ncbi:MAG TPA: FlgD immunoglobulin-like domain containing protein [Candidatus Krumholzibacteria bacterium]|nr:FlgD immunoglobulin-like domain containing protein [Candidatus Krumholzibacteria bacterium]HPD70319.1 FlgD immunoglobulin-like domain containing protein [Candidatus Krumholzibacteria bacterium]HRY39981.1 FlgD immunoglobulin-like domain containing protein [Candidatus Krumholzibacteria bacterium]
MCRTPVRPGRGCHATAALAVVLLAGFAAAASGRDIVPTPPGGGPGVNLFPADQVNPLDVPGPQPMSPRRLEYEPQLPLGARDPDLGGDDLPINTFTGAYDSDLAVASNGDLFAIFWYDVDDDGAYRFVVRRSDDGGTTWRDWGTFFDPTPDYRYWDPRIHVAEGAQDRCFVTYVLDTGSGWPTEVHVAWSPLDLETGDFSNDTIIHTAPHDAFSASLTTDAESFSAYYVYLAFSSEDGDGNDIHFVRSTDQGTTWESSYVIGTIGVSDRGYYNPTVAVGYGGWVHVVWYLGFAYDHEYDNAVRYRRAASWAGGGLASWENLQSLTSHTDDVDVFDTTVDASLASGDVMVAWLRRVREPDGSQVYDGAGTRSSADAGAGWGTVGQAGSGWAFVGDVVHQEVNDRWLLGMYHSASWGFHWSPVASPTDWSSLQVFSDNYYSAGEPEIVLDPAHEGRVGMVGGKANYDDSYTWLFDAEWRTDPGYPNFEDGFPLDLAAEPRSDPAVVDLDGDGYLEIVFGDNAGAIRVHRHDGTVQPGWPVYPGATLSPSPIAVGDLDGDGALSVVAGTMDGRVFAYDAGGTLMDGWPFATPDAVATYVAIGSVGGPYPRAVVIGAGSWLGFADWHGERYPGSVIRALPGATISSAPAVGDVDGDGRNEVVAALSDVAYAFPMDATGWNFLKDLEASVSGGVALGDFDLDGDVETVASLSNGVVHLLEGDGTEFPGAWPVTVATSQLNGAAIANCLGGGELEVAVTARSWLVSLLWYDGDVGYGWPRDTDGWMVYGKPIIARVEAEASDVIVGARGYRGWAWSNLANSIPGWPKTFENHVYQTPAYGDLDLDGNAEIVFLTTGQLAVVDIGISPTSAVATWGMAGHDPERSGCADCALDLVPVEEAVDGVTRVSLAAPWPNPVAGEATFACAVPVRAMIELAIFDVRGRLVATVDRAERLAGRHEISWHGRDDAGHPVASGQYLVSLRVRGPGVDETLTRKVTVLR